MCLFGETLSYRLILENDDWRQEHSAIRRDTGSTLLRSSLAIDFRSSAPVGYFRLNFFSMLHRSSMDVFVMMSIQSCSISFGVFLRSRNRINNEMGRIKTNPIRPKITMSFSLMAYSLLGSSALPLMLVPFLDLLSTI